MDDGIKSLEAFWNALPDANPFRFQFQSEILEMESAKRDIAKAEVALMDARNRMIHAWQTLSRYVENAAKKDWSEADISKAKQQGGKPQRTNAGRNF